MKLAYLVSHPIQYQAPLLRRIAETTDIDLTALFMSDFSIREYHDKEFGTSFKWDVPLVEGYKHQFLPTLGSNDSIEKHKPYVPGIKRILREGGYDVLWTHGYAHQNSVRAILAAKSLGMKVMVRAESQWGSAAGVGFRRELKNITLQQLFPKIDAFLCIGSINREYYRSFGVNDSKLFMVPYAVDNEAFQAKVAAAEPDARALRLELGIAPDQPIVLYCSKLTRRKRIMDVAHAFERVAEAAEGRPKPIFMVVGDGEMRPELEAWMEERDDVRFLGFRNQGQLAAIFAATDVFVLTSEREPWGLVVNEVMNARVPVIVSEEVGSHHDLVQEGENGFVIQTGDIDALADRLGRICFDPALRQSMGDRALRRVSQWGYEEDIDGVLAASEALGFRVQRRRLAAAG